MEKKGSAKDSYDDEKDFKTENKSDDSKNMLKWINFAKKNYVFGFDHLNPLEIPSMGSTLRGVALGFDRLLSWTPPSSLLRDDNYQKCSIKLQLSISMYHLKKHCFFGSTWMSNPSILPKKRNNLMRLDMAIEDIVYMLTRITDISCVLIVELIVSLDNDHDITIGQYGCGWTLLNAFVPINSTEELTDAQFVNCPLYVGSPRDLMLNQENTNFLSQMQTMPDCLLRYKIYNHTKLRRIKHLVAENNLIGRYDVIPGLVTQSVILPGQTRSKIIPCIGVKEVIDEKSGNIDILPNSPEVEIPISLSILELSIHLNNRQDYELKLISRVNEILMLPNISEVNILVRNLKIGIHNGHNVLSGEWNVYKLIQDPEDNDNLILHNKQSFDIHGYTLNEYMTIVSYLEYEIEAPVVRTRDSNLKLFSNSYMRGGKTIFRVVLGITMVIPYDGKVSIWDNPSSSTKQGDISHVSLSLKRVDESEVICYNCLYSSDLLDEKQMNFLSGNEDEFVALNIMRYRIMKKYDSRRRTSDSSYSMQSQDIQPTTKTSEKISESVIPITKDFDDYSIAESIVEGDSDTSSIRIDVMHYSNRYSNQLASTIASKYNETQGSRNLLSNSMQIKLNESIAPQKDQNKILTGTKKMNQVDTLPQTFRPLSRADRSKLDRYGYITDETNNQNIHKDISIYHHVDINKEISDPLKVSDVSIQFAGYKTKNLSSGEANQQPRSLYCTFQFYNCKTSKTEPMRLLPTQPGQAFVLVRDNSYSRDDPPLALRFIIDKEEYPYDALAFSEYLNQSQMTIDLWDTDSLLHIGSCFIPLKPLLRQGEPMVKSMLEYDIIKLPKNDVTTLVFENSITKGDHVGSFSVVMTHVGRNSKLSNKSNENLNSNEAINLYTSFHNNNKSMKTNRPSVIVRAKPLSESTPELSNVIQDLRNQTTTSMKSLSNTRGDIGSMSLTYDDISIIFRRFKGKEKGMIQYAGPLLTLLDVPNLESSLHILINLFIKLTEESFRKEIIKYSDSDNNITSNNLLEFFESIFNSYGVSHKGEEKLLSNYYCDKGSININDLLLKINQDKDRLEWNNVIKYIRKIFENEIMKGTDIMSLLNESDSNGTNYITVDNFKEFLLKLIPSSIPKNNRYIQLLVKYFNKNNQISLLEISNYFSITYSMNISKQFHNYIEKHKELIQEYINNDKEIFTKNFTFYDFEKLLNNIINISQEFSSQQINQIFNYIISKNNNKIKKIMNFKKLFNYFHINIIIKEKEYNINELLDMLINHVKSNNISLDQIFRHFDINGDGSITVDELTKGLDDCKIFSNIPNWESYIPKIALKFDKSNDGLVSLKEFYEYFGINEYLPDILQKLTKVFTIAIEKGLSLTDIFKLFDKDNSGSIDSNELNAGLKQLGHTFDELTSNDIKLLLSQFDKNNDSHISMKEFSNYFENRIEKYNNERKENYKNKLISKFRQFILLSIEKGLNPMQIFEFFDTDKSNTITRDELSNGLKKLPNFKKLSEESINVIVDCIDSNNNGTISKDEFVDFCYPKVMNKKLDNIADSKIDNEVDKKLSSKTDKDNEEKDNNSDNDMNNYIKSFFQNIAQSYHITIDQLLAKLDNDGDGLINREVFDKYLDSNEFYNNNNINIREVDIILQKYTYQNNIEVIKFLRYLNDSNMSDSKQDNKIDKENDNFNAIYPTETYEFSSFPDIKAVEMKLRKIGRHISTKGIDVEYLFRSRDQQLLGCIQRTEFIEILSSLGVTLIDYNNIQSLPGKIDYRQQQIDQIQRLKGKLSNGSSLATSRIGKIASLLGHENNLLKGQQDTMNVLKTFRQNNKKDVIQRVLSQSIAKDINIYPSMGKTMFFEIPFSNPFHSEERFIISIDDPDLRLITSYDEWITCRKLTRPCYGELGNFTPEMDMFDVDQSGIIQVSLLSLETIQIPISYLSFHQYNNDDNKISKTCTIRVVSGSYGHIVSVVKVHIRPQRCIINRTFHFYESENSTSKKNIVYISDNKYIQPIKGHDTTKFITCIDMTTNSVESNTRVLVEWTRSDDWNTDAHKLIIKYKCSKYPELGRFYINVYDDPYQIKLIETWEIFIHTCQRVDTVGSFGSVSKIDLLVKGDRFNRRLKAFTSLESNQTISFNPRNIFNLIPGSYSKVSVEIMNTTFGTRKDIINLVDTDSNELVSSYIVSVTVNPPNEDISQTYDIVISVGEIIAKKILFRNNWNTPRMLRIMSSDTNILVSRDEVLNINGLTDTYLRLRFHPLNDFVNVAYLFIIDEDGNCEETFKFNIKYK